MSVEAQFAAPPIIVVLPPLLPHEIPPAIDLASRSDNRNPWAVEKSDLPFYFIRQHTPGVNRQFGESNPYGPVGPGFGIRHFELKRWPILACFACDKLSTTPKHQRV